MIICNLKHVCNYIEPEDRAVPIISSLKPWFTLSPPVVYSPFASRFGHRGQLGPHREELHWIGINRVGTSDHLEVAPLVLPFFLNNQASQGSETNAGLFRGELGHCWHDLSLHCKRPPGETVVKVPSGFGHYVSLMRAAVAIDLCHSN